MGKEREKIISQALGLVYEAAKLGVEGNVCSVVAVNALAKRAEDCWGLPELIGWDYYRPRCLSLNRLWGKLGLEPALYFNVYPADPRFEWFLPRIVASLLKHPEEALWHSFKRPDRYRPAGWFGAIYLENRMGHCISVVPQDVLGRDLRRKAKRRGAFLTIDTAIVPYYALLKPEEIVERLIMDGCIKSKFFLLVRER